MRILKALLVLSLIFVYAAEAGQPPAQHNKAWYETHDGERNATLRLCHSDATYANLYDCQNAEAAGSLADRRYGAKGFMNSPSFWAQNEGARNMVLRMCANRTASSTPFLPYCRVAAMGQDWQAR